MNLERIFCVLIFAILAASSSVRASDVKQDLPTLESPPPPDNVELQQYDDISYLAGAKKVSDSPREIAYSEFLIFLEGKLISKADVSSFGQWIHFHTKGGEYLSVRVAQNHNLADQLAKAGADVQFVPQLPSANAYQQPSIWLMFGYGLLQATPWIIAFALIILLLVRGGAQRKKNIQALMDAEKERSEAFFERLEKLLSEKNKE